jgi:four helix bundle protein
VLGAGYWTLIKKPVFRWKATFIKNVQEIIWPMGNFKDLEIWKTGMNVALKSLEFSRTIPAQYYRSLGDQIHRAAFSIPANIAEGCGRGSIKDKSRFIDIATGSCYELETHILISQKANIGNKELSSLILKLINQEGKMLTRYSQKLKEFMRDRNP